MANKKNIKLNLKNPENMSNSSILTTTIPTPTTPTIPTTPIPTTPIPTPTISTHSVMISYDHIDARLDRHISC